MTRAGYYAWRQRPPSAHAEQDRQLRRQITQVFRTHRGLYGSPPIHRALRASGLRVSRRRVARLMREVGLRARVVRVYKAKPGVHRFYGQHPNRLASIVIRQVDRAWLDLLQ